MKTTAPEAIFFQTSNENDLWQRYCGFLDLSMDEFMEIQRYLLLEQVKLVANTSLGKKLMQGSLPTTVEMLRSVVPITSYDDYEPYLTDNQDDALAEQPYFWCHSAGRGGKLKWIPYTKQAFDRIAKYGVSVARAVRRRKKGRNSSCAR